MNDLQELTLNIPINVVDIKYDGKSLIRRLLVDFTVNRMDTNGFSATINIDVSSAFYCKYRALQTKCEHKPTHDVAKGEFKHITSIQINNIAEIKGLIDLIDSNSNISSLLDGDSADYDGVTYTYKMIKESLWVFNDKKGKRSDANDVRIKIATSSELKQATAKILTWLKNASNYIDLKMQEILLEESTLISSSVCVNDNNDCKIDIKTIQSDKQSVLPLQLLVCLDYKNPSNNQTINTVSKITINTIGELIALYCSIVPSRKTIYSTSCILYNAKFDNDIELSPYSDGGLSIIVPTEQHKHVRLPALSIVEVDLLNKEIAEWLQSQICKAASDGNHNYTFIADKDFIPGVVFDTSLTDYLRSVVLTNVERNNPFPIYVAYSFIASVANIPSGVCCVYKLTDTDSLNHYLQCFKKGTSTVFKSIKDLNDKIDINVITYRDGIIKTITDYNEMNDDLKRKVLPIDELWQLYEYNSDCINHHVIPRDNSPVEDNVYKEPVIVEPRPFTPITRAVADKSLNDNNAVEQAISELVGRCNKLKEEIAQLVCDDDAMNIDAFKAIWEKRELLNNLRHKLSEIESMFKIASKFQLNNSRDTSLHRYRTSKSPHIMKMSNDIKPHGLSEGRPSVRTPATDPRFGMNTDWYSSAIPGMSNRAYEPMYQGAKRYNEISTPSPHIDNSTFVIDEYTTITFIYHKYKTVILYTSIHDAVYEMGDVDIAVIIINNSYVVVTELLGVLNIVENLAGAEITISNTNIIVRSFMLSQGVERIPLDSQRVSALVEGLTRLRDRHTTIIK